MAQPDSAELKLMRSTKFPPSFARKVDIRKVNMEVMKKWVAQRITELLGMEDDVTVDFAYELMNDKSGASFNPNIKLIQIKMQGFLGEEPSAKFCSELWELLLSAQESSLGVPSQLLEAKKAELMQEREAAEKRAQEDRQRKERDADRDRDIDERRQRDRRERNDRRDREYRGGGRGGRRYSPRPRSRSPPRRRTYGDNEGGSSYRSRYRSRSRSRTPPRYRERRRDDSPPSHRRQRSSTPPRKRRAASQASDDNDSPPARRRSPPRRRSPSPVARKKRQTSYPSSDD